ncbi:hypothetical protein B5807_06633 [Epicoccum nigrum]|uniref:Uncharacterized protein n=1 Tax=Epicoccum nigrum TaxID=105696 RepID=A0A1Y2LYP2_EPING|nr:hypothetical protein B5807_06633 [Epicoccum nigrum]
MSHLLQLPRSGHLPSNLRSAPYVVFGINGCDVTASLPPQIPLNLVLHFAPNLRQWVLPPPDLAVLPRCDRQQHLHTPCVGIDIRAPIDSEGLHWVIACMLSHGGCQISKEFFGVHPDLTTSLAIHNTWLALELPFEGLRVLHTHVQVQLLLSTDSVSLHDMRLLWSTFPHDGAVVKAMGKRFKTAYVRMNYRVRESHEIMAWFNSSPELYEFFLGLEAQPLEPRSWGATTTPSSGRKRRARMAAIGFETVGKKAGSAIKETMDEKTGVKEDIRERAETRTVSPRQKQEREDADRKAMAARMRRIRSDNSLRSIDTVIWHTESFSDAGDAEKEKSQIGDGVEAISNYLDEEDGEELALTLSPIPAPQNLKHAMLNSSTLSCPADLKGETQEGIEVGAKRQLEDLIASAKKELVPL